jgi:membrane peptidoglycan carboxypeptidase
MADVVNGAGGTGHKCKLDGITVCGKSGTAQVVGDRAANVESGTSEDKIPYKYRDNGWFIAFAPKDHPQIAVACIIEHGGHGGDTAAPVIKATMERFFQLYPPIPETAPVLANTEAKPPTAKDTDEDSNRDAEVPETSDSEAESMSTAHEEAVTPNPPNPTDNDDDDDDVDKPDTTRAHRATHDIDTQDEDRDVPPPRHLPTSIEPAD